MLQITRKADGAVLTLAEVLPEEPFTVPCIRFRDNKWDIWWVDMDEYGAMKPKVFEIDPVTYTVTDPDMIPRKEVEDMLREIVELLNANGRVLDFISSDTFYVSAKTVQSIAKKRGFEV